ncbi:MAG TPA: hypothetical protein VHG92_00430 [Afifellaceae bacterium]|nr:hypothetical protein [Afifellaceae bacterium]
MSRTSILIGAVFAFTLTASAATARPFKVPQAGPSPEAAALVEPVHYRKVRKFRGHHPHIFFRRHHRPSFSFSLNFGAPVVRHYPRYYPYRAYQPYYASPYDYEPYGYYRPSYAPRYYYRW